MSERGMTHVVAEPDRLDEILVQAQPAGDDARDSRCLERVRHPRSEVIALRVDENLCLALEAAKRLRMDDPVTIALERRTQLAIILLAEAAAPPVRTNRN